jgi:hypothetical protein
MTQVGNNQDRFGGEYMIQDSDHMSGIAPSNDQADTGSNKQADQSQNDSRQQGGDRNSTGKKQRQSH